MEEEAKKRFNELVSELAKSQVKMVDLFPDIEKDSYQIESYEELAEILAKQNMVIIERVQGLASDWVESEKKDMVAERKMLKDQLEKAKSGNSKLTKENEVHLRNIETLAKQLELYKCKSSTEIDRKISAMETKTKQEAKELRQENEHLKEMIAFNEEKISTLQKEIDRLKITMRAEAEVGSGNLTHKVLGTGMSQLEKKIGHAVEEGKLEYRIILPSESAPESKKELTSIMNLPQGSLAKAVLSQGKMLESIIKEKGEDFGLSEKLLEMQQEREKMDSEINSIGQRQSELNRNFGQIIEVLENIQGASEFSPDVQAKIAQLKNYCLQLFENAEGVAAKEPFEEPRPGEASVEEAQVLVNKCFEEKKLIEGIKEWSKIGYETRGMERIDAINKLKAACKCKDMQAQKLQEKYPELEEAEQDNSEIADIIAEYSSSQAKYPPAENREEQVRQLRDNVEELKGEISKKEALALEQARTIEMLENEANSKREKDFRLEETTKLLQEKEDKIAELNMLLSSRTSDYKTDKPLITDKGYTQTSQAILGSKAGDKYSPQKPRIGENEEETKMLSLTAEGLKGMHAEDLKVSSLLSENAKNRGLLRELMSSKDTSTTSKVNKLLYDNNNELNNKLVALSEEIDIIHSFIEELGSEHKKASATLMQVVKEVHRKSSMGEDLGNPLEVNKIIGYEHIHEGLMAELQSAKNISTLATEISFAAQQSQIKLNPESLALIRVTTESAKAKAAELYKEYFSDEKIYTATVDSLLARMKQKNALFKGLFQLYEESAKRNEDTAVAKKTVGSAKQSPSKKVDAKPQASAPGTIKNTRDEPSRINVSTAAAGPESRKEASDDRMRTLESKVVYLNTKLLECNRELDKQEEAIKQKDRNIELMELELGRKEDETKQMASLSEDLKKDLELTKQALQQSEREHSARMPAFEELKEK